MKFRVLRAMARGFVVATIIAVLDLISPGDTSLNPLMLCVLVSGAALVIAGDGHRD